MKRLCMNILTIALGWSLLWPAASPAQGTERLARKLEEVGIEEQLGKAIPLDLAFRDETGAPVTLGSYVGRGKPVLLNFVYHDCPMLCSMVLDGLTASLREIAWLPGNEFEVLTVSFSPTETPELAARQKAKYVAALDRAEAAAGWHFLTGDAEPITRLADAAGFEYRWDEELRQYAHAAALVLLSPDGKITRYLYGVEYPPFDLRNALVEAGEGRIGTAKDRLIMFCYQYDPSSNSYVPHAMNLMKLGGLVTMLSLGSLLAFFWRRERRRQVGESAAG